MSNHLGSDAESDMISWSRGVAQPRPKLPISAHCRVRLLDFDHSVKGGGMLELVIDVTAYLWLVWLVIVLTAVVVELLTLEFTFLMIAAGSLLGGLGTNLLGAPWWVQVSAAAVVTALLLFTIRPVLLKVVGKNDPVIPTNVDALAGIGGVVYSDFAAGSGSVKLRNGEIWTARGVELSSELVEGDQVCVVRVEGATVVVEPARVLEEEI